MIRKVTTPETPPTDTAVELKKATPDDLSTLLAIDKVCFEGDETIMEDRFTNMLTDLNRRAWLVIVEDTIVGKIHARMDDEFTLIHGIGVFPEHQRKGYGSAALKLAINALLDHGITALRLEVEAHNESALNIYRRCGFEIAREDAYWRLRI